MFCNLLAINFFPLQTNATNHNKKVSNRKWLKFEFHAICSCAAYAHHYETMETIKCCHWLLLLQQWQHTTDVVCVKQPTSIFGTLNRICGKKKQTPLAKFGCDFVHQNINGVFCRSVVNERIYSLRTFTDSFYRLLILKTKKFDHIFCFVGLDRKFFQLLFYYEQNDLEWWWYIDPIQLFSMLNKPIIYLFIFYSHSHISKMALNIFR